ncbi:MAG: hypothetical protein H7X80_06945, partial [bacterium]|nr:hypothetical protein [Candidatus Kapabacteria bacterium]
MALFESRPLRRRSILKKRDDAAPKVSLVRSLLIANLIVSGITAGYLWLSHRTVEWQTIVAALAFTNPITVLAHY